VPLNGQIVTVEIRLPGVLFAVLRLGSRRAMRRWCPSGRVGLLGLGAWSFVRVNQVLVRLWACCQGRGSIHDRHPL